MPLAWSLSRMKINTKGLNLHQFSSGVGLILSSFCNDSVCVTSVSTVITISTQISKQTQKLGVGWSTGPPSSYSRSTSIKLSQPIFN